MMQKYDSYKDSGVQWLGEIPIHWEICKTSYIFNHIGSGTTPNSGEDGYYSEDGFPFLQTGDLNDSVITTTAKKVTEKAIRNTNLKIYPKGSLVIAMYGATIGKLGILGIDTTVNQACCVLPETKKMNTTYAYYQFMSAKSDLLFHSKGGGQPNISQDTIRNERIVLPPLSEQQAIAAYLDEQTAKIDTAIAQQQKMIDLLNERKQIIINCAVTKGLNPNVKMKDSGVEWIGEVPEHWEICKLKALGTTINGVSHDSTYFGEGFPFVSYSDVYKNMELPSDVSGLARSSKDEQRIFSVEEGDVFFTRTSETAEEIGFTSTCMKTIPNAVFAGFLIRFRPYRNRIDKHFSKFYFRAEIHRSYFVKEMNLVIRASLSQQLLKGLPVLLPPLNEQKGIARFLEEQCKTLDNSIASYKKQIALLQERKQIIINDVVTGKAKVC